MTSEDVVILQLRKNNANRYSSQFKKLLQQLSRTGNVRRNYERRVLDASSRRNSRVFVAVKEGKVICTASLIAVVHPSREEFEIHDVVRDKNCDVRGIGRMVMEHLLEESQHMVNQLGTEMSISLTSHPSRIPANEMYLDLGFKLSSCAHMENGEYTEDATNRYVIKIAPQ